jgi:tetratricopeptide (TPR) repeat protein
MMQRLASKMGLHRCYALRLALIAGVTAITPALAAEPASAQSSLAWKSCMGEAGWYNELQVSGCNLVIQSGKATEKQLALVYHRLGRVLWGKQDYEGAIGDFNEAIRLEPNLTLAYADRCFVSAVLAQIRGIDAGRGLRSALKDCDEALRLSENYTDAHITRGFIYLKLSDFDSAVSDFDRVLQLQPPSAAALYGRGLARSRKGEEREGNADIAAAKEISPSVVDKFEHSYFTK